MTYFITFLEGIITFISPCLLPMLPIYLSYFAGGNPDESQGTVLKNAVGFVLGFTIVFVAMGAFAGSIGALLRQYQTAVNLVSGLLVILFGLNFLGLFNLNIFKGTRGFSQTHEMGFLSALLFGLIFAVGWTPCVGAFLGSALMLASQQGSALQGILLLLCYSAGLGHSFSGQRPAHPIPKERLRLDQGPLWNYYKTVRPAPRLGWYNDGHWAPWGSF